MKRKILFILLVLITFTACSKKITIEVNNPLEYSVGIKNNAEFILIKEGTSIEEATQIIKENLEMETNADSYEFDWYGEALSSFEEDMSTFTSEDMADDLKLANDIVKESKELTLNHDSFRPIELIFTFTKNQEIKVYYKQILLCVAEDDEYNVLLTNDATTVEDAYIAIYHNTSGMNYDDYMENAMQEGYFSNIKKETW